MSYKFKPVVIFGNKDLARLAHYYLQNDSEYTVVGLTVNEEYISERPIIHNVPLIAWEKLEKTFPPDKYKLFIPVIDNKLRRKLYLEGKDRGYDFISYVSSKCTNLAMNIGENCFIQEDNTLQPFTVIDNNCILWAGNHIGHDSIIDQDCFITSHVVISGHCHIKQGAYLGVNSTIRDQTTIGKWSIVGMGSVVTKNIPDGEIWLGSPARKK